MSITSRLLSIFVLVTALALLCFGQGTTGTITGVVKDPKGAVIPNAKVLAHNVGTGADMPGQTDDTGSYLFSNLVPGEYAISVEASGFRKAVLTPQRLSVGDVMREDVTLEIGQVTETVTVDAQATQVNTVDAQLGKAITEIPNLPILSAHARHN